MILSYIKHIALSVLLYLTSVALCFAELSAPGAFGLKVTCEKLYSWKEFCVSHLFSLWQTHSDFVGSLGDPKIIGNCVNTVENMSLCFCVIFLYEMLGFVCVMWNVEKVIRAFG